MFKKYTIQLSFYALFIAGSLCGSAHDTLYGLRTRAHVRYRESLEPKHTMSDEDFDQNFVRYVIDLPSAHAAENTMQRIMRDHKDLELIVRCMKNPQLFKRVETPSGLLFLGPPGSGKTYAAKALAKYCEAHCIFVHTSEIGNTYQNSGATLIHDLFTCLFKRPEKRFIVVIDDFMTLAQWADSRDMQQKKAAIALSQRLDDCRHKRNVCVIGTGYGDPETLTPRFKTRFAYNIFTFPHIQPTDIAKIMREILEESGGVTSCGDQFLTQLAQSVKYLPIREIDNFVEESKALAVVESGNPEAIVTEQHVTCIFNQYKELTWFEKVWKNRNRHFSNVVSPQAVSLYMAIGGLGLLAASQYKNTGLVLTTLGFCMTSLLRG